MSTADRASDAVHDAQHELSHAIDASIATAPALAHDADPFKVSVRAVFPRLARVPRHGRGLERYAEDRFDLFLNDG